MDVSKETPVEMLFKRMPRKDGKVISGIRLISHPTREFMFKLDFALLTMASLGDSSWNDFPMVHTNYVPI